MLASQFFLSSEKGSRSSRFHEGAADYRAPKRGGSKYARMLACVDDTPSAEAVAAHSVALASSLGLALTFGRVLEAHHEFHSPADPVEWQLRNNRLRIDLERMATESGVNSGGDCVLLRGLPAEELSNWADENGATLMAVARRGLEERAGLGATAQRLLDEGQASLLFVPPIQSSSPGIRYRHIMVPIDGSARSESILPIVQRIARAHDAEIVLVHVVPRVELVDPAHAPQARKLGQEIHEHNLRHARQHLDRLRTHAQSDGLKARIIMAGPADPRSTLLRIAREERVDLVVMSSHGSSGSGEVSCGSVTEYFALHTSLPLLIVRPNLVCGSGRKAGDAKDVSAFRFD